MRKPDRNTLQYAFLVILLALGLYLRVANLGKVQHFQGDQGRAYVEVMKWVKEGEWPLLGPLRHVGAYDIGPGWYYVVAPLLAVTGFHPIAGAVSVALISVVVIFLSWFWIRAGTGSEATALAVAAVMTTSCGWVEWDRILWNPNMLIFATIAFCCLLDAIPKALFSSFSLLMILCAFVPQWHTTGFLLIAAAAPPAVLYAWKARDQLKFVPAKKWLGWSAILVAAICFLYIPPLLYELGSSKGNVGSYFQKAIMGHPKEVPVSLQSISSAVTRVTVFPVKRLLNGLVADHVSLFLVELAFLFSVSWAAHRYLHHEKLPSLLFMLLLLVEFWLAAFLRGQTLIEYHFTALTPVVPLLIGFTAGTLLKSGEPTRQWTVKKVAGLLCVATLGVFAFVDLPKSLRILKGRVFYDHDFVRTKKIAQYILGEAGHKPYSMVLLEPGNFGAHFQYLLWRAGQRPQNHDYNSGFISRENFGEKLFVIARRQTPSAELIYDKSFGKFSSQKVEDAIVYQIPLTSIPSDTQNVIVRMDKTKMLVLADTNTRRRRVTSRKREIP